MRTARAAPIAGLAFVVCYVVAWFISQSPDSDDSSATIAAYYADKDHRVLMIVSAYLFIVAGLLFLGFLAGVRARLRAGEGEDGALAAFSFAAGIVFVGLLCAGALTLAAVPAGISFGGAETPTDGQTVNFIQSAGFGMILVGGMLAAAAMIAATSLLTLRTNILPRWSAWLGFVAALALLFAVIWIPQIALLIWVIAISVVLLRAPSLPTSTPV
jgi:MFS family permease